MSSTNRKRKSTTTHEKEGRLSKRAKFLSSLWASQEEIEESIATSSTSTSKSAYRIKAIIGERPGEYLIDWADDPSTGRKFKADWQPKRNANTAAVNAWRRKQIHPINSASSKASRQRRKRQRHTSTTSSRAAVKPARTPESSCLQRGTISYRDTSSIAKDNNSTARSTKAHNSASYSTKSSDLIVPTSERDLYIAYHSSHSTQGTFHSVPEHPDSGLGASFSEPDTPPPCTFNSIVPDSQSLPGSSSYIPSTSSTGRRHYVGNTLPSLSPSLGAAVSSSSQQHTRSRSGSTNHEALQIDDSLDSFLLETELSKSLLASTQSLVPEVITSSADDASSSILGIDTPLLARATSDPTHLDQHNLLKRHHRQDQQHRQQQNNRYHQGHGSPVVHASDDRVKYYSKSQRSQNSIFQAENSSLIQVANSTETSCEPPKSHSTRREHFVIAEDQTEEQHPSQATTIDDSVLSLRDPNSQSSGHDCMRQSSEIKKIPSATTLRDKRQTSSPDFDRQILPGSVDSQEPPQPPPSSHNQMSDISSEATGSREGLNTRANLRKIRADSAKKLADRKSEKQQLLAERDLAERKSQKQQSDLSDTHNSPSVRPVESRPSMTSTVPNVFPVSATNDGQEQSVSSTTENTLPSPQAFKQTKDVPQKRDQPQTIEIQAGPGEIVFYGGYAMWPNRPEQNRLLHGRVQAPAQSQRASATPPVIPSKRPYESQEEPDRLAVEPLVLSKDWALPARNTQSVSETPNSSDGPSTYKETLASQTENLRPIDLGPGEIVIPLAMSSSIRDQYIQTIGAYGGSVAMNIRELSIKKETISTLSRLLGQLANVSTHNDLEGGGPGSQEKVDPKHEAAFAEISSEKFKFLGILIDRLKDTELHISLIVKQGLASILMRFLKGKDILYEESGKPKNPYFQGTTLVCEKMKIESGKLAVSVIVSGETLLPTIGTKADLVVALDESFNAAEQEIIAIRKPTTDYRCLTPVVRLVGYSSAEHLVLCLPRALNGIARIRTLTNYVSAKHIQDIFGLRGSEDPSTESYAKDLAACLQDRARDPSRYSDFVDYIQRAFPARPIEGVPVMDTDSSLSDAMSETGIEQLKGEADYYFPYHNYSNVGVDMRRKPDDNGGHINPDPRRDPAPNFGGVSEEARSKRLKMAGDGLGYSTEYQTHSQLLLAIENPTRVFAQAKAREAELVKEVKVLKDTISSHENWAERRQGDYEDLRDKWSNLHHDKIELTADLEQKTKEWEKCRTEILSLKGERGTLKKEIETLRLANLNSPNPSIANAERDAARFRTLEADKASLQKKVENLTKESSYIREAYQQASSSVSDLTNEVDQMKPDVEHLGRLKEDFKAWRKAYRDDPEKKTLRDEVESQKTQIASLNRMLLRKEKQIETLERGRGGVQTRGSSAQPRSPRGGGSRGVSPTPGQFGGSAMAKGLSGLGSRFNLGD